MMTLRRVRYRDLAMAQSRRRCAWLMLVAAVASACAAQGAEVDAPSNSFATTIGVGTSMPDTVPTVAATSAGAVSTSNQPRTNGPTTGGNAVEAACNGQLITATAGTVTDSALKEVSGIDAGIVNPT